MSVSKPWTSRVEIYDPRAKAHVWVTVEVTVDWHKVALKLARNAVNSKHGKSGLLFGAIKGKIVEAKGK